MFDSSPKIRIIAENPLFADLPASAKQALASVALLQHFESGECLFEEGDSCPGIYLLAEGKVKIFKTSPSGRQIQLGIEAAPSSVAEIPLFDGGVMPASVSALTGVAALLIRKEDFRRICLQEPEVSLRTLAKVGMRLRHLVGLVEQVTFGKVRQRLAQILLEYQTSAQSSTFTMAETHEKLALRLGTVREVISRNLSRFQAEGFIQLHKREMTILNPEGLRQEAETEY